MNYETIEDLPALRDRCKRAGFAVIRYDDGALHSYPYDTPWLDDPEFSRLYDKIRANTLVDRIRCHALANLCEQVRDLPGDILEIGVWRGGHRRDLGQQATGKDDFFS